MNPPVEAPASSATLPRDVERERREGPGQLHPAPGHVLRTVGDHRDRGPGVDPARRRRGREPAHTDPTVADHAAAAAVRDSASPRRTSSTSRRRLTTVTGPGYAGTPTRRGRSSVASLATVAPRRAPCERCAGRSLRRLSPRGRRPGRAPAQPGRRPGRAARGRAPAPRPGPACTTPRRRARGRTASPGAAAKSPSVVGRSPTITPRGPRRWWTISAAAANGLPATSGVAPLAVATAATIEPAPGSRPPDTGYVASRLVATNRAPSRTAREARSRPSKSKSRWKPTTTAAAGGSRTGSNPARVRLSTTPGPPHTRTREPGREVGPEQVGGGQRAREHLLGRGVDAAPGELGHHVGDGHARVVRHEADDESGRAQRVDRRRPNPAPVRRRARPRRRGRGTPPDAPRAAASVLAHARVLGGALQRAVVLGDGAHRHGQAQVAPGPGAVTRAEAAQAEPEVGVVVHRVELERRRELRLGRADAPAASSRRGRGPRGSRPCPAPGRGPARGRSRRRGGSRARGGGCPPGMR